MPTATSGGENLSKKYLVLSVAIITINVEGSSRDD